MNNKNDIPIAFMSNAQKILDYLGKNPNSIRKELVKDLVYKPNKKRDKEASLKMSYGTLHTTLKKLLEESAIWKNEENQYFINPTIKDLRKDYLSQIPEYQRNEEKLIELLKEQMAIRSFFNIAINSFVNSIFYQKKESLPFVLGIEGFSKYKKHLYNLILECFFENSDNWEVFKKQEDFHFKILIEINLDKISGILKQFEYLKNYIREIKNLTLEDKKLYYIGKGENNERKDMKSDIIRDLIFRIIESEEDKKNLYKKWKEGFEVKEIK